MICKTITYYNFRNIESETLSLCPGVNVLWGENAQGKSNMLEGIYFFARGRSFRGAKEKELVNFAAKEAGLMLSFLREGESVATELSTVIPQNGKKIIKRNGARLSSVKEMIGSFRAVLFCPAHLSIVGGGPGVRRSFLDIALSQLYPAYLDSLSEYNKALCQRSALIKTAAREKVDLGMWEIYAEQLSEAGARIAARRNAYIRSLNEEVASLFCKMTDGGETPSLIYKSDAAEDGESDDEILQRAKKRLYDGFISTVEKEIRLGAASHGVHRDDIIIKLNAREAKLYASQGQQRSLALAMKLAEGELSKKATGEYPIFLLDDVLSELDGKRRAFILNSLRSRQIIVTSCDEGLFGRDDVKLIRIENGRTVY